MWTSGDHANSNPYKKIGYFPAPRHGHELRVGTGAPRSSRWVSTTTRSSTVPPTTPVSTTVWPSAMTSTVAFSSASRLPTPSPGPHGRRWRDAQLDGQEVDTDGFLVANGGIPAELHLPQDRTVVPAGG